MRSLIVIACLLAVFPAFAQQTPLEQAQARARVARDEMLKAEKAVQSAEKKEKSAYKDVENAQKKVEDAQRKHEEAKQKAEQATRALRDTQAELDKAKAHYEAEH